MGQHAHLPPPFGRPGQNRGTLFHHPCIERAAVRGFLRSLSLAHNYPALRNRISSDFHAGFFSGYHERTEKGLENRSATTFPSSRSCAVVCFPTPQLSSRRPRVPHLSSSS